MISDKEMMNADYAVIVAGGKGLRMGGDIPKQFLPICGLPVLMRTIYRFIEAMPDIHIILVLPEAHHDYWEELCMKYAFKAPYMLACGGETRFHSVKNGLALIPDNTQGVVGVHDGVRPFPSVDMIRRCYSQARISKAVIPVTSVVETLRHIDGHNVMRDDYRLVQTPQTFDIQLLKQAYQQPYITAFTDDASVVEHAGGQVIMVEGNRENIKITTPFDLQVANAIVSQDHQA